MRTRVSRFVRAGALWGKEVRGRLIQKVGHLVVTFAVNQQIQEIALIRQSLYELEAQHAKIRGE